MLYAVFEDGSRQYQVSEGEVVRVDYREGDALSVRVASEEAAFVYVLLAGFEVPAQRTLYMLTVAAIGLWLGRPGSASVVWLWALAVVLAWDPWATLTPGLTRNRVESGCFIPAAALVTTLTAPDCSVPPTVIEELVTASVSAGSGVAACAEPSAINGAAAARTELAAAASRIFRFT